LCVLFKMSHNGLRIGTCGNKFLLNCQPAQMYVLISNVCTNRNNPHLK
jgi:hypothetical protein